MQRGLYSAFVSSGFIFLINRSKDAIHAWMYFGCLENWPSNFPNEAATLLSTRTLRANLRYALPSDEYRNVILVFEFFGKYV